MHQIRPWLYVASYPEASSAKVVADAGATAMLQLFEPFDLDGVETLYLDTMDGYPLVNKNIRRGVDFVRQKHAAGKTVVISCGAGISRSVTYTIAVLKELEGLSMEAAYRSVRDQHPDALPDQTHWESLNAYYDDENTPFWEIWKQVLIDEDDDTNDTD